MRGLNKEGAYLQFCSERRGLFEKGLDREGDLKDESEVDKIIVKKQPYQLLNTNREFFSSFDPSNFHKLVNESF